MDCIIEARDSRLAVKEHIASGHFIPGDSSFDTLQAVAELMKKIGGI